MSIPMLITLTILGTMGLTIGGGYILWGLINRLKYKNKVAVWLYNKSRDKVINEYYVKPNSSGKVTLGGQRYDINTDITNAKTNVPGGAPSLLQETLEVSLHVDNNPQACPIAVMNGTKPDDRPQLTATGLDAADDEYVITMMVKALNALGKAEKFLTTTNVLIIASGLVGILNLYMLYKINGNFAHIIQNLDIIAKAAKITLGQ